MKNHLYTTPTPLGPMLLLATDQGLSGAWFVGQRHFPAQWSVSAITQQRPQHRILANACEQLQGYFEGRRQRFDLPLDLSAGTVFQQAVWQALLRIDWGHTSSYGQLASQLGRPKASRAVGTAVGRNPISIIVPCHRVLGSQGALTGYAGGLERKQDLLTREGVL